MKRTGEPSNCKRGEIWLIDWNPSRGPEQAGRRPGVIVQNDAGNRSSYPNTIVVAVSTAGRPFPWHVPVRKSKSNGLREDSFVKCEQLVTISKSRLIGRPLGRLGDPEMRDIDAAIADILALPRA